MNEVFALFPKDELQTLNDLRDKVTQTMIKRDKCIICGRKGLRESHLISRVFMKNLLSNNKDFVKLSLQGVESEISKMIYTIKESHGDNPNERILLSKPKNAGTFYYLCKVHEQTERYENNSNRILSFDFKQEDIKSIFTKSYVNSIYAHEYSELFYKNAMKTKLSNGHYLLSQDAIDKYYKNNPTMRTNIQDIRNKLYYIPYNDYEILWDSKDKVLNTNFRMASLSLAALSLKQFIWFKNDIDAEKLSWFIFCVFPTNNGQSRMLLIGECSKVSEVLKEQIIEKSDNENLDFFINSMLENKFRNTAFANTNKIKMIDNYVNSYNLNMAWDLSKNKEIIEEIKLITRW